MENQWHMMVKLRVGIIDIKKTNKNNFHSTRESFRIFDVI